MIKNISANVIAEKWLANCTGQLFELLHDRGCTNEEIQEFMTTRMRPAREKVINVISDMLRIDGGLSLKIGDGRTTEELVRDGNYSHSDPKVNSANFPVRAKKRVVSEIVLLESNQSLSSEEALAEAVRRGLKRPTYEDALHFGIEYPEAQRKRLVVFLHEPWHSPCSRLKIICLFGNASQRNIGLGWFGNKWKRGSCFPFVQK